MAPNAASSTAHASAARPTAVAIVWGMPTVAGIGFAMMHTATSAMATGLAVIHD